ncbi:hypothetical protein [Deinococcus aestuarii]|uniref:hypothetical protein n=1 Tax=Deinococcus aestuarii TaxID=2774531 RepID=UPI001C0D775E|nr:hypothetical protein [Deinococcus aestuarii]
MNRRLFLAALLAVSGALAQTAPVPSPADLARERELVRRALGTDFGPINVEARLLVGQLPPQPLGPLPRVPAGQLIGSVVRSSSTPDFPDSQSIFFDSAAPPAQVQAALQASLKALGWTAFNGPLGPSLEGGFQSEAEGNVSALAYYRLEQQVSLHGQIRRVGAVTRVTLNLNRDRNLREQLQFREGRGAELRSNLPTLRPPGGANVQPSGGGGGGGSWTSYASIQSSLSAAQLLEAFGAQLQAAGWTPLTKSTAGKTVTSVWRFTDQDQNEVTGLLTIRNDAPGRYSAQLASLAFRN